MFNALKNLTLRRVFGKEVNKSKEESHLITSGIFRYSRNPVYFSAILLFAGWAITLRLTFLLILTILFAVWFYILGKWEEKELTRRFGEDYLQYKRSVSFFFSVPKKQL
jgi:protein-S-isoprenylcysteine O-methyltransferase Ste14